MNCLEYLVYITLSKGRISQNFVAFPEYMNFINYFDLLGGQGPDAQVFGKEDESVVEKYLPFCGIGLKNAQLYER